jgi:hypothetical protein
MYVRTCTALHSRIPHLATCTTLELYKPHLQPGVLYYWTQTLQCCDIMTLQFRGENKSTACSDYRYTHTWVAHTTLELYKLHLGYTHHTWAIQTTLGLHTPHLSYTNYTWVHTPHLSYTNHTWVTHTTLELYKPHLGYTHHNWVARDLVHETRREHLFINQQHRIQSHLKELYVFLLWVFSLLIQ